MNDVLAMFWGKLGSGSYPVDSHPVMCHLIDVGNITHELWARCLHAGFQTWMSGELGITSEEAGKVVAFWVALHDIGKLSPAFQQKSLEAKATLQSLQFDFRITGNGVPHGIVSAAVLPELLRSQLGLPKALGNQIAQAVGGHHGRFCDVGTRRAVASNDRELGSPLWHSTRADVCAQLRRAFDVPEKADWNQSQLSSAFLMALAGLTTVADWIGSMSEFFPPAGVEIRWEQYATCSRKAARRAVDELGWSGWEPPGKSKSLPELFPFITAESQRPLQTAVANLVAGQSIDPTLVVIEAPMGEGKTEAAMMLADHWAASSQQRGIYFALPTMATSNQMFGRVREFLKHRYPEQQVNLLLLHGRASLSEALRELLNSGESCRLENVGGTPSGQENVLASQWFTYRKRGLLAPFGVGTIDQALMAVLQTSHVFVRLFSLAHKTVIIDEVHAYDAYMTSLLERLLAWLRELGASVVLLSATLPKRRRQQLFQAWGQQESIRDDAAYSASATPYPRISWFANGCVHEQSFEASSDRKSTIAIRWIAPEPSSWGGELARALQDGGCAAVICNTVQQAQDVYRALGNYFPQAELDLFHARFPYEEREARERRCLNSFGNCDGAGRPTTGQVRRRNVLVATQVIEQSLDLDFDLMVLDGIAPIDLCLQRAGRLHRHQRARPAQLTSPELWITETPLDERDLPDFESNGYVYSPHVLLRTLLTLRHREQVRLPDDMEEFVESVYDDEKPMPDGLSENWQRLWASTWKDLVAQRESEELEACQRLIKPPAFPGDLAQLTESALAEDDPFVHLALQALTRLTRPSVDVVCLFDSSEGPRLSLDGELVDLESLAVAKSSRWVEALIRRSVTLSRWSVVDELTRNSRVPNPWESSPLLRQHHVLLFDAKGEVVDFPIPLRLDSELGIVISTPGFTSPQSV